ncbi:MAG: MBOAT family protein [Ignavibacteriales bacterium]|nr:MBOAT family protein [Ignavibacteriales bacterium]
MNWKPAYAVLILTSTIITWLCSILVARAMNKNKKKIYLTISLIINFGILIIFKYFNFINITIFNVLDNFKIRWNIDNLDVLLPVGISFYTFQAVGYTIDVYRGDLKAEKHFGIYALFVSFFPQLVAGPIERAKNLLQQFYQKHDFSVERLENGLKQMIWGYFMKVVVADRLALFVNAVYNNVEAHNGTTLLVATIFFSFQIYCDFAGYSNIAIGAARIMGFDLMTNFKRPYFSMSISEFWHRWHISLSTWFRDYLYIPLGGNKVSKLRNYFNLMITFIISGIWHGANWTFVIWGTSHGILNAIQKVLSYDKFIKKYIGISKILFIIINLLFVNFIWIFFRANTVSDAFLIINKIFTNLGTLYIGEARTYVYGIFGITMIIFKEFYEEYQIKFSKTNSPIVESFKYALLVIVILSIGVFDGSQFIYFQF